MEEQSDWTPLTGWRKAAMQIPIRTVIALAIAWGAFWVLRIFTEWLQEASISGAASVPMVFVIITGVVAGAAAGAVMGRKLAEKTGLIGSQLIAPVLAICVAGIYLLHCITGWTLPEWVIISAWVYAFCGVMACITAGAMLLLDS